MFLGDRIWAPAVFGIYIFAGVYWLICKVEGPTHIGRVELRESRPELIVIGVYTLTFIWCTGRQAHHWVTM